MKTAVTALAVVLCLALPSAAMAGTASLDVEPADLGPGINQQNLNYRAAAGETNRLSVSFDGSTTYTLTDTAGITPGQNCSSLSATKVSCVQSSGIRLGFVLIKLGDRDDRVSLSGHGARVLGGAGSDVLKGSEFADTLSAGSSEIKNARAHTRDRL